MVRPARSRLAAFALLILEDLEVAQAEFVQTVVAATVLLSIVLHGMTAAPLSKRLGRRYADKVAEEA